MSEKQKIELSSEDWNVVVNTLAKEPYNLVFTIINNILQQLTQMQQKQPPTQLKEVKEAKE